ncbi:MAG: 2,3-bisphosphoglycerate-independent phosphoglycerate mutase, partial [Draconibacterium sp.]|nr:2,3-bisphosphoglycerate-independent phosphoglycerate mutase [Draconibacterium sp.]
EAVCKAVVTIDGLVKDVVTAAQEGGFDIMIIADHGNADFAVNKDGSQNTAHSLNPVPCIFISEKEGIKLQNGVLADVAPTLISDMGLEVPAEMTGKNLIASPNPSKGGE